VSEEREKILDHRAGRQAWSCVVRGRRCQLTPLITFILEVDIFGKGGGGVLASRYVLMKKLKAKK
jgi:hypothetical protein